jgi:3-oxoacyl-[acyl-carrier-protein] synthase II
MTNLSNHQVVVTGASFVRADTFDLEQNGAQEFESYNLHNHLPKKGLRFRSESARLFCSNAFEAVKRAELGAMIQDKPHRVGVYHATELANLEDVFDFDLTAKNDGPGNVSPMRAPNTLANVASGEFTIQTGITGPNVTVSSGYTSGLTAIDVAMWHLEDSQTDGAVVGSVDVHSHYHQRLWEAENSHQETPLSPEMAAAVILERADSARARNAKPICAIAATVAGHACLANQSQADQAIASIVKAQARLPDASECEIDALVVCCESSKNISEQLLSSWRKEVSAIGLPEIEVLSRENEFGDNTHGLQGLARAIEMLNGSSDLPGPRRIAVVALDSRGISSSLIIEKM